MKRETRLSKTLAKVDKKEEEEEEKDDDVLKSVKFGESVLSAISEHKRIKPPVETLDDIGKPLCKEDEGLTTYKNQLQEEKKKFEVELEALRKEMEVQKAKLEKELEVQKEKFEAELNEEKNRLRQAMENDLEAEKQRLLDRYNSELDAEEARLKHEAIRVKDELKRKFQTVVAEPEPETPKQSQQHHMLYGEFATAISDLKAEIKSLRSHHDRCGLHEEFQPQLPRSRSQFHIESDFDSGTLTRSLTGLQQRVQAIEKSLTSLVIPFPIYEVSSSGAVITTESGSWTVDEQLHKSKMWLKQRNQFIAN